MKHTNSQIEEELKLVETINKMSSQINFAEPRSSSSRHSEFLIEIIEQLEEQLESIRKNRQLSSPA